ncbi:MAG: HAD hydrolase-like protein [Cytophagales bacterium]|nr:HAD hydrolase-like protein [Cytophagales bacterium]
MKVDLVVFDMAGTTVKDKNFVHKAFVKAFAANGIEISEEVVNPLMGYPKPVAIKMALEHIGETFNRERIDTIHKVFVHEMVNFYKTDNSVEELPGVSDTWEILKNEGVKIAIDTGFSRIIMNTIIERLQWRPKIDFAIASDMVERGRPYRDMIDRSMEEFGISDSGRVAKVGDTSSDMLQGKDADCGFIIGVTTGAFNKEELRKFPATHIIDNLTEMIDIIS